jgi:hypothetical protein
MRTVTLSPSALTFDFAECPPCFYRTYALGIPRGHGIFPSLFNNMETPVKDFVAGMRTEQVHKDLPPGVFYFADLPVVSEPIILPGRDSAIVIRGRLDSTLKLDSGNVGLVDIKFVHPRPWHMPINRWRGRPWIPLARDPAVLRYKPQLHAYLYAMERRAPGARRYAPVETLGLLCLDPRVFYKAEYPHGRTGNHVLSWGMEYVAFARDEAWFHQFLNEVLDLLENRQAPPPNPKCAWCRFWLAGVATGVTTGSGPTGDGHSVA